MEVSWRREDDAVVAAFVPMVGWAVVVVAAVMVCGGFCYLLFCYCYDCYCYYCRTRLN